MPSSHQILHRHFNAHHGHDKRDAFTHTHGAAQARSPAAPSEALLRRQMTGMEESVRNLESRSTDISTNGSDQLVNILLVILGILFLALALFSLFLRFRRLRRQSAAMAKASQLPTYQEKERNPHNLTIETTHNGHSSVVVYGQDGRPMLQNPNSPPDSADNVPEIRITFPDEQDSEGHAKSGRVLIVRVGENASVGLEPVQEEQLPAYEKDAKEQFYSIDMNQIGGLKDEKDRALFQ